MADFAKSEKKALGELAAIAHRRELEEELGALEGRFQSWRRAEITCHELSDAIHDFHQGPSRTLWGIYCQGHDRYPAVVNALARGVLKDEEVPPGLRDRLLKVARVAREAIDRCERAAYGHESRT